MSKFKVLPGIFAAVLFIFGGFFSAGKAVTAVNFDVTKASDDGSVGTLRWAITQANSSGGANTIYFRIPKTDPYYDSINDWWKITLSNSLGALPSLTDNGTTIYGYNIPNSLSDLDILIDGSLLGGTMSILTIESDYNHIQSLTFANAPGAGINIITGASNNTIRYSYIGIDPNGVLDWGNATGIKISSGANHNTIDQCVISGNDEDGVLITGNNTDDNIVRRSYIGLNAAGTGKIPNNWDGVAIANGAEDNIIGGGLPTEADHGNVISGNNMRGVYLYGEDTIHNEIKYNYIGVNKSGGGNPDVGNLSHGIMLEDGPDANPIYFNVISGNKKHGIYLTGTGTTYNWIKDNIIGADPELNDIIPNGWHGVAIYDGANHNEVGDDYTYWWRNVIVGSGWSGIAVVSSWENNIYYNIIGTDKPFSRKKMGNRYHGIDIVNSWENEVGMNYVAYNGSYAVRSGIEVEGSTAISNTISMNNIHDNSGGGIDLVNGGNKNLPAPTITATDCTKVEGSTTCLGCRIEIFSDWGAQGKHYEGYAIAHSVLPQFSWSGTVRGPNVTVTATDYKSSDPTDYQNTSEFSLPWLGACHTGYFPITIKNH
jgi:hypothetical protein